MSDWWNKRLGGDPPSPRQESTPPTQTPRWQPQPAGPPQPNWAGAGGAGAAPVTPQGVIPVEEQALDENEFFAALNGQIAVETRGRWAATEVQQGLVDGKCPECGSNNYFSRIVTESGTPRRGPAPMPQCHDCGYPLLQSGSGSGLPAAVSKGARPARQPAPGDPSIHGF